MRGQCRCWTCKGDRIEGCFMRVEDLWELWHMYCVDYTGTQPLVAGKGYTATLTSLICSFVSGGTWSLDPPVAVVLQPDLPHCMTLLHLYWCSFSNVFTVKCPRTLLQIQYRLDLWKSVMRVHQVVPGRYHCIDTNQFDTKKHIRQLKSCST